MRHHRARRGNDGKADKYVLVIVLLVWNVLMACNLPVDTWRMDGRYPHTVAQRK